MDGQTTKYVSHPSIFTKTATGTDKLHNLWPHVCPDNHYLMLLTLPYLIEAYYYNKWCFVWTTLNVV